MRDYQRNRLIVFDQAPIHFVGLIDEKIILCSKEYDTLEACVADARMITNDAVFWKRCSYHEEESFEDLMGMNDDFFHYAPFYGMEYNTLHLEMVMKKPEKILAPQTRSTIMGLVSDSKLDFIDTTMEYETSFSIMVFYGTDRKRTSNYEFNKLYGKDRDTLDLGICKVNVPGNKKFADWPRPQWWKLRFRENPEKDAKILKIERQKDSTYYELLSQKVNAAKEKNALLFVHGYNVEFSEAAWRTAQLAYDLSFDGVPIMYSWPSQGKVQGYTVDEKSVKLTVPHFAQFIKGLIASGIQQLHLIIHGMSSRALAGVLRELESLHPESPKVFDQIILAAPDINATVFKRELAPVLCKTCKRATLYVSSRDRSIRVSRAVHRSIKRAGQSGRNMVIVDGIDTIDASNAHTGLLGHGYFETTAALIGDIHELITRNASPEERKLVRSTQGRNVFWKFPEEE